MAVHHGESDRCGLNRASMPPTPTAWSRGRDPELESQQTSRLRIGVRGEHAAVVGNGRKAGETITTQLRVSQRDLELAGPEIK